MWHGFEKGGGSQTVKDAAGLERQVLQNRHLGGDCIVDQASFLQLPHNVLRLGSLALQCGGVKHKGAVG